jgi:hypothetical protein
MSRSGWIRRRQYFSAGVDDSRAAARNADNRQTQSIMASSDLNLFISDTSKSVILRMLHHMTGQLDKCS